MKLTKNRGAVAKVMDEMAASFEQNLRRPVNQVMALIEEIRAMQFAPQDDAILAAKLREVLGTQFSEDLARLNAQKEAFDTLVKGLKALRDGLAGMRIK